jgi:uncharacterized membrane protein
MRNGTVIGLSGSLCLLAAAHLHAQSIQSLGSLPFGGSLTATALSGDGSTVIGSFNLNNGNDSGPRPFRWTAATGPIRLPNSQPVSVTRSDYYGANAVSALGDLVAGYWSYVGPTSGTRPLVWQGNGAVQQLPLLNGRDCTPLCISKDGLTIAGRNDFGSGVYWRNGTVNVITPFNGQAENCTAINSDGSIMAGNLRLNGDVSQGYLQFGTSRAFTLYGAEYGGLSLHSMSNDGSRTVGRTDYFNEASGLALLGPAVWVPGLDSEVFGTLLPLLPGTDQGDALVISGNGRFAGGWNSLHTTTLSQAVIYDFNVGSVQSASVFLANYGINMTGWSLLTEVRGISDNGLTFAGNGVHEYAPGLFRTEGWVATIPAPTSVGFVAIPGMLALRRRRWN